MNVSLSPLSLLLSDPQLDGKALQNLLSRLKTFAPAQIFVYGRLLERYHADLPAIEAQLAALGYVPDYGFDANIARGFRLTGTVGSGTTS